MTHTTKQTAVGNGTDDTYHKADCRWNSSRARQLVAPENETDAQMIPSSTATETAALHGSWLHLGSCNLPTGFGAVKGQRCQAATRAQGDKLSTVPKTPKAHSCSIAKTPRAHSCSIAKIQEPKTASATERQVQRYPHMLTSAHMAGAWRPHTEHSAAVQARCDIHDRCFQTDTSTRH